MNKENCALKLVDEMILENHYLLHLVGINLNLLFVHAVCKNSS